MKINMNPIYHCVDIYKAVNFFNVLSNVFSTVLLIFSKIETSAVDQESQLLQFHQLG